MVREQHKRVPALLENVETVCQFVSDIATAAGMSDDVVHRIYLSVEEVCTNIIEHGYRYMGRNQVIDVVCKVYSDRLSITIIDDAKPFNPLSQADPDPSAPLIERHGGGWGIFFVKKYMDDVWYQYVQERNHLTIEKMIRR